MTKFSNTSEAETKTDNINQRIIITVDFYVVISREWDFEMLSYLAADKIYQ